MLYLDFSARPPEAPSMSDILPRRNRKPDRTGRRGRAVLRFQPFWLTLITTWTLMFLFCFDIVIANANPSVKSRSYFVKNKNSHLHVRRCKIFDNPPMHTLMDNICDECHKVYAHANPNMRSECRSKCFKSEQFRSCLYIFQKFGSQLATHESNHLLTHVS